MGGKLKVAILVAATFTLAMPVSQIPTVMQVNSLRTSSKMSSPKNGLIHRMRTAVSPHDRCSAIRISILPCPSMQGPSAPD